MNGNRGHSRVTPQKYSAQLMLAATRTLLLRSAHLSSLLVIVKALLWFLHRLLDSSVCYYKRSRVCGSKGIAKLVEINLFGIIVF